MKHLIVTRCKFGKNNRETLNNYLKFANEIFIPSLKSQENKDFTLCLILDDYDIEYLKNKIDYPFIYVHNFDELFDLVKTENWQIQTRHDIDDWMSPEYTKKIREICENKLESLEELLIHPQPCRLVYSTGEEFKFGEYHNRKCCMHLTLCQRNIKYHIYQKHHGKMWELTDNIIMIGEGYTKWVGHDHNTTYNKERGYDEVVAIDINNKKI